MPPRVDLSVKRRIFRFVPWGMAGLLSAASLFVAHAQLGPPRAPAEAKPFIIERRQIGGGTTTDPWLRFELRFGEPREKCRIWRFEAQGRADGHAVFDLKEPVDQSIILEMHDGPQHLELLLGDVDCSYRIRIERNK